MLLHGGLHHQVISRRQRFNVHEIIRQGRVFAEQPPIESPGIVRNFLRLPRTVGHQHIARIAVGKNRFNARGDVVGKQRNGAGRRDRGQQRIPNTVRFDGRLNLVIEGPDVLAGEVFFRIV